LFIEVYYTINLSSLGLIYRSVAHTGFFFVGLVLMIIFQKLHTTGARGILKKYMLLKVDIYGLMVGVVILSPPPPNVWRKMECTFFF